MPFGQMDRFRSGMMWPSADSCSAFKGEKDEYSLE